MDGQVAKLLRVRGVVQGVGFRPFVWRLAGALGINGWVRNDASGVSILAQGGAGAVEAFSARLSSEAPPLARVDAVESVPGDIQALSGFVILESTPGRVSTSIGHDTCVCPDCLAELFDPKGRRWRHAFITCTHCGPRYSLTRRLPYDRRHTSLAPFPLCAACAEEYVYPADRRFHAETNCCPQCGPRLGLLDSNRQPIAGDPIAETLRLLQAGAIVAIKGLGGFHLVCNGQDASAVARLRQRKHRDEKPLALLFANTASAAQFCSVSLPAQALLESPERPIVLLPKQREHWDAFPGVSPGLGSFGVMLPSSPIQFLLFHEQAERPAGFAWLQCVSSLVLVCTSANPGGEPIVIGNDEALARLDGIADAFLLHDREIVVRCDDSVCRLGPTDSPSAKGGGQKGGSVHFIRRARGYVPRAIPLTYAGPSVLALGGWFKNTVCVTRGQEAFVSQHIGDLDNRAACAFLEETVTHLLTTLDVQPELIARDLHPDFHSSRFAEAWGAREQIPVVAVQHHHAHIASVLAEHGRAGPALGLALDGVGLGWDGGAWGGELLRLDGGRCQRLGHLAELPLPGGDRAAREPWRMAAAALFRQGRGAEISRRFSGQAAAAMLEQMLVRRLNSPETSSMGRLFDAAAGLLGGREVVGFEGQAAMWLEAWADTVPWPRPLALGWRLHEGVLDVSPLLSVLMDCHDPAQGAALFHATLVAALADWVAMAAEAEGVSLVACGGGCFLNALLARHLRDELVRRGLDVLLPRLLPANDGGLSLGQAWVACLSDT